MSAILTRQTARPGTPLSRIGGLPPSRTSAPTPPQRQPWTATIPTTATNTSQPMAATADSTDQKAAMNQVSNLSPSLGAVLRPQAAYRWLLPNLASITPLYIENVLRGALAGNHVQAWEIFDLMIDSNPEIAACVGEYVDGICEKKLIVEPYHEEDEEPSLNAIENQKIISSCFRNFRPDPAADENAFRGTVRDILFGRFHNQSVLEEDWYDTYGTGQLNRIQVAGVGNVVAPRCTFWVHPVCYAWDMSGRLGLRVALDDQLRQMNEKAKNFKAGSGAAVGMGDSPVWNFISSQPMPSYLTEFPANKFLISVMKAKSGTALGSSCLRSLAWWWCVENFCGDWLLDLAQLFGIPFRKATYSQGTSEEDKATARDMLQNMGARGWCLLPEGVVLDFEKAMESGEHSPEGFMIQLAERQMRKVILRQTMTGKDSSTGKGFGEQEGDVKSQCLNAGALHVCEVLREQMARHILRVNKGRDDEVPFISLTEDDQGGLQDAQTIAALSQAGAGKAIGLNWIGKRFGIPQPTKDEQTLGDAPAAPTPGADRGGDGSSPQNRGQAVPAPAGKKPAVPGKKDRPELAAGDVAGHEFHGNQYAEAQSAASSKTGTAREDQTESAHAAARDAHLAAAKVAPNESARSFHEQMAARHEEVRSIMAAHEEKMKALIEDRSMQLSPLHKQIAETKEKIRQSEQRTAAMQRQMAREENAADVTPAAAGELQASEASGTESALVSQAGDALAKAVAPLLKYLRAGLAIKDEAAQLSYFERAIEKWPELTAPLQHDGALAEQLTPTLVESFVAGLNAKAEHAPAVASKPLNAGDVEGHEFHGNQYVELPDEKWTGTPKEMHQRADTIMKGFKSAESPQLGTVEFTRLGRNKTLYDKRTPHEFQSVQALPRLVEQGNVVSSLPDRKGRKDILAVHKIEHGLKIGDAKYKAELTVRETNEGKKIAQKFYLHRIAKES
jgi:hypothetical protein